MILIMNKDRFNQILSSSLWAAYGDALGFPTELASEYTLKKRIGQSAIETTQPWKRLVGGKFGANAELPAGAYSDDTQLRLATSRALTSKGGFDVESFAKVELPTWLNYALGAGRGSKAAASELSNKNTNWYTNFFKNKSVDYVSCGGNGAAMRIQPHVWSAVDLTDINTILSDVIRNSICTHGHLRGIAGAVVHAMCLIYVMRYNKIPPPEEWLDFTQAIEKIPSIIDDDYDLSVFWKPVWEEKSNLTLSSAAEEVAEEWADLVGISLECYSESEVGTYKEILKALGGMNPSERGSGLKSALFSLAGASLLEKNGIENALILMANQLGSDTDTIATMAGALLGANLNNYQTFNKDLQDKNYLMSEAERCYRISLGELVAGFKYPDLLYWEGPKSAIDAVKKSPDGLQLLGLGVLKEKSEVFQSNQKGAVWRWFNLPFGQSVLCKVRSGFIVDESSPKNGSASLVESECEVKKSGELFSNSFKEFPKSLDEMTEDAIKSNFDPELIGKHVLEISSRELGIELVVGYVAIIAKAKRARERRFNRA